MQVSSGIFTTKYEKALKEWPKDAVAQCGGGEIDGIGKTCFFEVFFNDFHVRGEGATKNDAENNAWDKYQIYQNCEHTFKRISDSSDVGRCEKCGMNKKGVMEVISCCAICQKKSVNHYVNGIGYTCYKHYKEDLIDKNKSDTDSFSKNKILWINEILEEVQVYKDKSDLEIYDVYNKCYRGFFEYMMMSCELIQRDNCKDSKKHFVDLYEDIEVNENAYKASFKVYINDNKSIKIENIEDFREEMISFIIKNG